MVRSITLVVVIAGFAAAIRVAGLAREPLFVDEAYSARYSADTFDRMLDLTAKDTHPPLYYLGLAGWRGIFGDSVPALRSFGVLWSLIGLAALALLTQQLVGDREVVIAVVVAAVVHPLDVHFSQTARMYSQLAALSTLAAWILWRWMISSSDEKPGKAPLWAAAYAAAAIALLYTHYLGSVILVAQGVFGMTYFARNRRLFSFGAYLVCAAVAAMAFLPWLMHVLHFRNDLYSVRHLHWIPVPGLADGATMLFNEMVSGLAPLPARWAMPIRAVAVCCVVGVTVLLVRSLFRPTADSGSNGRAAHGLRVAYAAWLLIGPIGLALIVSRIYHPILYPPRFALVVLPPFLILLGLAIVEIDSVRLRKLVVAVFLGLLLVSTVTDAVMVSRPRTDGFVRVWQEEGRPDLVVFFPAYASKIFSYSVGERVRSATRVVVESLDAAGTPARVWVCTTPDWRPSASNDREYREWLLARGPSRVLIATDDLEIVEIDVGRMNEHQLEIAVAGP